jgi:hypothetical protein
VGLLVLVFSAQNNYWWAIRFLHLLGIRSGHEVGNDQTKGETTENGAVEKQNAPDYENWSWLGDESPLFSNKTETEWLLQRLSRRLEDDLGRQRSSQ